MKQILITIFFVIFTPVCLAVSPIPSDKLFKNADNFSLTLSPNGKYILSYDHYEKFNSLELIDPIKATAYPLLELAHQNKLKIKSLYWVDDKTVYIKLGDRQGFLHIDYSAEQPVGKWQQINAKGYLVSPLATQEDLVLFAYNDPKTSFHRLYIATTKQVENSDFSQAKTFGKELNNANFYSYDENFNALLSFTFEDDSLAFWYLPNNSKKWKKFLTLDKKIEFIPVGFLDHNTLAVLTNKDQNLISLAKFDINSQTLGEIIYQHPMYDLTDAELNANNKGVKWVKYIDHGIPKTHYFTSNFRKLDSKLKRTFENQQISILGESVDNNYKLIGVYSSDNPGKYFYYDDSKQKAIYIKPEYNDLEKYKLTKSTTFDVKVDDNINLEAILTIPEKNANGVLLVYPHGGPVGIRDFAVYNPELQYLASRGYSVLNVNFRGSSGFGKDFLERGKDQFGKLIEKDITAVVEQVRKQHKFNKMCSIGSSYGGYSAVMLAIYHPEDYQCVVSLFGVYDLPHLFNANNYKTLEENRKGIAEIVGNLDDSLKEVSPFYFAEKLNVPILLMAGKEDTTADFEQANRMKYRLLQLNKDVEYLFYDDVGHGHNNWRGDRHQFAFIDDFLRRKLGLNTPLGDDANAAQAIDMIAIADAYNFDDHVENDSAKAAIYYQQAADLGESRAMFNIGSYYHRGEHFDKSIDKAIDWYKKSSNAGYADASYRLGNLFRDDYVVEQDLDSSYQFFLKAKEQEADFADIAIAQAHCLGEGTERNIDKCLNGLFLKDKTEQDKRWLSKSMKKKRRQIIAKVLWHNQFNSQEKQLFNQNIKESFELDVIDVEIDDIEYGLYGRKYYQNDYYSEFHDETTLNIPIKKDTLFGAIIKVESDEDVDVTGKPLTMLKVRWTLPEEIREYSETTSSIVKTDSKIDFQFKLSEDHELIAGDWTLEILSLTDKVLFKKTFTTFDPEKVEKEKSLLSTLVFDSDE